MEFKPTRIPDVVVIEPKVFGDDRGFFMETFRTSLFSERCAERSFVQENHSLSKKGILRGLHYQIKQPQGKLVRVIKGAVFDVAVDMRQSSPTFGQWVGEVLSADNKKQLWVPEGFAHGFYVMSEEAEFVYKCTDYWAPEFERSLLWSDHSLAIDWPTNGTSPALSKKDEEGDAWQDAEKFD